jgi:hypothetical protein
MHTSLPSYHVRFVPLDLVMLKIFSEKYKYKAPHSEVVSILLLLGVT